MLYVSKEKKKFFFIIFKKVKTELQNQETFINTFSLCPKVRYMYIDIPNDIYAYNLILKSENDQISHIFSKILIKYNNIPNIINDNDNDYLVILESNTLRNTGYTFKNLKKSGRWWIAFICTNFTIKPYIQINWDITATCKKIYIYFFIKKKLIIFR